MFAREHNWGQHIQFVRIRHLPTPYFANSGLKVTSPLRRVYLRGLQGIERRVVNFCKEIFPSAVVFPVWRHFRNILGYGRTSSVRQRLADILFYDVTSCFLFPCSISGNCGSFYLSKQGKIKIKKYKKKITNGNKTIM